MKFLRNILDKIEPKFEKGGKFERKNIKDIQFDTEKPIIVSEDKRYNFDKSELRKV